MTDRRPTSLEDSLLLGIDVGTSGARATLVDRLGLPVTSAVESYGIDEPKPGWAEQDPDIWWAAVGRCVREVVASTRGGASRIASVGVTGQMQSLVLVGADGSPARPAIVWPDRRSEAQCEQIARELGGTHVHEVSGLPVATGFLAPSLLWVREHEPETYAGALFAMLPKDYVRFRLTGVVATDPSDACGTLLYDLASGDWSAEIVSGLGLRETMLPPIQPSASVAGSVSADASESTQLVVGTPVIAGGGDQATAAISLGLDAPGRYGVGISTGGTVLSTWDAPTVDPAHGLHTLASTSPGQWILMGAILSAGLSFDWLAHALDGGAASSRVAGTELARLDEAASTVEPGADGLIFLPYLRGERTPHLDPEARGCFIGLTTEHTRAHLARAVMEGVAFALAQCVGVVAAVAGDPTSCVCFGGGTRSGTWCQIVSDVLGTEVESTPDIGHSARGVAMLAGAIAPRDLASCANPGGEAAGRRRFVPDDSASRAYAGIRPIFEGCHPALSGVFAAIAHRRQTGPDQQ